MTNVSKGKFIVIEGCEGAGKSTAVATVHKFLVEKLGICEEKIIHTREPGGTPIAEQIRTILKTVNTEDKLCSEAEMLLMYASRIQLINRVIKPALEQGCYVIGDRHDLSSVAYQGAGRQLGFELINSIRKAVLKDFKPDLTILLDLSPEVGLGRAASRGELDRFELEDIEFFNRIRNCFLDEAHKDPENIKIVNAEDTLEKVTASITDVLAQKL